MKGNPEAFLCYEELGTIILKLSDAEAGILFKAMYEYFFAGVIPDFESNQRLFGIWAVEQSKLDRDRKKYFISSVKNSFKAFKRDHPDDEQGISTWFEYQKILRGKENRLTPAFNALDSDDLI